MYAVIIFQFNLSITKLILHRIIPTINRLVLFLASFRSYFPSPFVFLFCLLFLFCCLLKFMRGNYSTLVTVLRALTAPSLPSIHSKNITLNESTLLNSIPWFVVCYLTNCQDVDNCLQNSSIIGISNYCLRYLN